MSGSSSGIGRGGWWVTAWTERRQSGGAAWSSASEREVTRGRRRPAVVGSAGSDSEGGVRRELVRPNQMEMGPVGVRCDQVRGTVLGPSSSQI